ncbi:MAG: DNA-binding protein [Blastocatellia bacterium]
MKNSNAWTMFLAAVLMSFLTATVVFAQQQTGQRKGMPRYDPATEATVTGIVQEVKQVAGSARWSGTHLTLDTDAGAFDVHVGPSAFLTEKGFTFAKGDQIEVTGSKVKYEAGDALIARVVKKGGKVLTLRDAKGFPVWSRRNR